MKRAAIAVAFGMVAFAGAAQAESFEDMCLRVSDEWGTQGDVAGQCSCLADAVSGDAALTDEFFAIADSAGSDEEAYEAGSDGVKAAMDSCSVDS